MLKPFAALLLMLAAPALAETDGGTACDMLDPGEAGGVSCQLRAGDTVLGFDYSGSDGIHELIVRQTAADGTVLAFSDPISVEGVHSAPGLRDVTGDGVPELFVPVFAGMVNVSFDIWMAGADGIYAKVGEIAGFGVDGFDVRDGLILSTERDNAAVYIETAQQLGPEGLAGVYVLEVDYAAQACTLLAAQDLSAYGLSAEGVIETCQAREWE